MKQYTSRRKHNLALLWLSLLCLVLPVVLKAERLPVKIYTSADGLGSSFVDSIFRDLRGFMWFCIRDGLSRFDGSRFVTYQIGEKDAAPAKLLENIKEAVSGGAPMSPEVAAKVITLFREFTPPERAAYLLTPHEIRLLKLLIDGYNYTTAAKNSALVITP